MKYLTKLLSLIGGMSLLGQLAAYSAPGDAERIATAMRAIRGRFDAVNKPLAPWPACTAGSTAPAPAYPSKDYYKGNEDDTPQLFPLVDALRGAIRSLATLGFASTGNLDQQPAGISYLTTDSLPEDLKPGASAITILNYSQILDEIQGEIQKFQYYVEAPYQTGAESTDVQSPDIPGLSLDDAKNMTLELFQGASWSPMGAGTFFGWPAEQNLYWGTNPNDGAGEAEIVAFRMTPTVNSTNQLGSVDLFVQVEANENGDPQPPVPADFKWHIWNPAAQKAGSTLTWAEIGDSIPAFPNTPPQVSATGWQLQQMTAILTVAPPDRTDQASCQACTSCSSGSCPVDYSSSNDSVHVQFGLGAGAYGTNAGGLVLYSKYPYPILGTRAALTTFTNGILRQDAGGIRQIETPYTLIDVVTVSAQKYEIRYYYSQNQGPLISGLRVPDGDPFKVMSVEDLIGDGTKLQIKGTGDGYSRTDEYDWNADTASWTLNRFDGTTAENLAVAWNDDHTQRAEVRELRDANNVVVQKTTSIYQVFAWGEQLVTQINDPDGQALTTTWQFYTDQAGDGQNYAKIKSVQNPDGSWERYAYDASARLYQKITPFQNTPLTADPGQCRVETHLYSDDGLTETIIQSVQGQEVGRRYMVSGSSGYQQTQVVCTHSGAAIDDPTNLVTITTYAWFNSSKKVQSVQHPDGTVETNYYWYQDVGRPTGDGTMTQSTAHGQQTSTLVDAIGNFVSQQVTDLDSGLVLSSANVTNADDNGRPQVVTYDDGSSELTSYVGCCGLAGSRTDRQGITTAYTYDSRNNLLTEGRAGITMVYTYDALSRRLTTTRQGSAGGQILVQQDHYNVAGQKDSSTNALSQVTTFAQFLNASGFYEQDTTLPGIGLRVETQNADGSLQAIGGVAAHPMQYEYGVDADGLFTKEIRLGDGGETTEWVKNYVDFAGRPSKTLYPDSAMATISYNGLGQMSQQVDPDGITTTYGYNDKGDQTTVMLAGTRTTQIVSSVTQVGIQTVKHTETSVTPANGAGLTVIGTVDQTPNGLESWITRYGMTTHVKSVINPATANRTDTETRPDGTSQITQYNLGQKASVQLMGSGGGQLAYTTFSYDQFARLQTLADTGNGTTVYSYTDLGEILSIAAPGNQTTTRHYDDARRVASLTLPDNSTRYSEFYPTGELKSVHGAQTHTSMCTYDSQGRLKTLTTYAASGNATTTLNYSPDRGFLVSRIRADGKGLSYAEHTAAGRFQKRVGARGEATIYGYNATGDLISIAYSDGTPNVQYGYDGEGRRTSITDGSGTRTLGYTDDGQLTTETYTAGPLAGVSTTRSFDGFLRRSGLTISTPGKTLSQSYEYDAGSRINSIHSGDFAAQYTYVPNTNLLSQSTLSKASGATLTVSRSYDPMNRLAGISTVSSTAGTIASYGYQLNTLGQQQNTTLADGSTWQYTYDPFGQVTDGKHFWPDATEVAGQQFHYEYDSDFGDPATPLGIGNRTKTTINGQDSIYTANVLNQYTQRTVSGMIDVVGEAAPGATVTVNGDATSRKGSYFYQSFSAVNDNSPIYAPVTVVGAAGGESQQQTGHTYLPKTPETFSYDDDGNLTRDGRWTYTWDAEDRLTSMLTTDEAVAAGTPNRRLFFSYDDQGRRIKKQVDEYVAAAWTSKEIHFIYDGFNILAETEGGGGMIRSHVWGLDISGTLIGAGGIGGLLCTADYKVSGLVTERLPVFDGTGNVVGLVDAKDGHGRAEYSYDPFGRPIRSAASFTGENPFRFSTKYEDLETGLVYYGRRYYTSELGRWLSRDPIGEDGGLDLYAYVENRAGNAVDPVGMDYDRSKTLFTVGAYAPWGGTITGKLRGKAKDCCRYDGKKFPNGLRENTVTITASVGLGLGSTFQVLGVGYSWQIAINLASTSFSGTGKSDCGGDIQAITLAEETDVGLDQSYSLGLGPLSANFSVSLHGGLRYSLTLTAYGGEAKVEYLGVVGVKGTYSLGPDTYPWFEPDPAQGSHIIFDQTFHY